MDQNELYYHLYRDSHTTTDELVLAVVDEIKQYVFDAEGIIISPQGYSGVPLSGHTPLSSRKDDIWKVLNVLFRLSHHIEGLVFRIETKEVGSNPFYNEAMSNDVIPRWANSPEEFTSSILGFGGVLHVISPEIRDKYPGENEVDIVRKAHKETRNILVTESVKQKIDSASARDFGMQRTSVNVPQYVAYVAKQRPDLLSAAIREFSDLSVADTEKYEKIVDSSDCVMVHIVLNETDWKTVTEVADIESPNDIVSHRVALALVAFDDKYSSIQNGLDTPSSDLFRHVPDAFERERLESSRAALFGKPQSLAHRYQLAKSLTTNKHHAECRKLFVDGNSSSADHETSVYSGDEEESYKANYARKQVFKKKRGDLGKKRALAKVVQKNSVPEAPSEEYEIPNPTSSSQLRNFERAVNGDDIYKESSDGDSLGEDEDMDLFITKPKKAVLNGMKPKVVSDVRPEAKRVASDDDGGFDVADLLRAAPPIAKSDDFDDI